MQKIHSTSAQCQYNLGKQNLNSRMQAARVNSFDYVHP